MTSITRLRILNLLYSIKETTKSVDVGMIQNESANIIELIDEGFNKLEYIYLLKTKRIFMRILDKVPIFVDYTQATLDYANFAIYVLLIGYLDAFISKKTREYDELCDRNDDQYILVAQAIADANDLRKCVMKDYAFELGGNSLYLDILEKPKEVLSNMGKVIDENDKQKVFSISGFYQAYLEGYKLNNDTDINQLIHAYQKRKISYVKYRTKCNEDLESVGVLLIKENNPLL